MCVRARERAYVCGDDLALIFWCPGNVAKKARVASGDDIVTEGDGLQLVVDGARSTQLSEFCFQLTGNDPALVVHLPSAVDVSFVLVYAGASDDGKNHTHTHTHTHTRTHTKHIYV